MTGIAVQNMSLVGTAVGRLRVVALVVATISSGLGAVRLSGNAAGDGDRQRRQADLACSDYNQPIR